MKKILGGAAMLLVLAACGNGSKEQEKKLFDEVMELHNEAMETDERAMANKAHLDSLLKLNTLAGVTDTAAERSKIRALNTKLAAADDAMMNWMHQFEPEYKNKAHDEVMKYMSDQKAMIKKVDAQLNDAIKQSGEYISQSKQK